MPDVRSSVPQSVPEHLTTVRRQRLETAGVALAFLLLTILMTWPHATVLSSQSVGHQDVYFNLWRLRWIAHALLAQPLDLFDGNIFHPEPLTLTFSDALLVEGIAAAPLFWIGLPPVLVHNLVLWAALVGSAAGMFVLVRELTRSRAGAFASAVVFTFAPYRFDHYMHMELQWTVWIPWAFWALHRTVVTGSRRYGVLTGLFMALQLLSCIYYGIFLAILLPMVAVLVLLASNRPMRRAAFRALMPGALVAAIVCGAYAAPYLVTRERVGGRGDEEIHRFSARPSSYLIATPDNLVWGDVFSGRSRSERRLFPGATALVLAFCGLMLRRPSATRIAYLLAMVAAFELSLGFSGYSFPLLQQRAPVLDGLRAMARAGLFVLFFVAALAGFGYALLAALFRPAARAALAAAVMLLMLAEYRVRPLALVPYPNEPPPLYAWLAEQPPGVVVELPMPAPDALPGADPRYSYLSTFHWNPMLNGYSGYHPPSYLARADALREFPSERSIARLHADGAQYVIVHLGEFEPERRAAIRKTLATRYGMARLAAFPGPRGESVVFAMQ